VGVSFFRNAVTDVPENERWPGFVLESCDATVAHWRHLAQVVGAESVTLGSDFNGFILRPKPGGDCPQGIRGTQDLPTFFSALEKHGVPRSSLDRSGARLLEIWAKVIEIGETSRL
jgi:microsomal dipeptidase-like Zn-dependent dipeptidase